MAANRRRLTWEVEGVEGVDGAANRRRLTWEVEGVEGGGECAAEKAVQPTVLPCRAAFTIAMVKVKWTGRICQFVCIKYMDGRSLKVKVPRLGSVADLRAAVAARTEVAATTVGLFVTGRDGEELRDNQPLVDVVGRNAGATQAPPSRFGRDACWTCTACFCTNGRSVAACVDCQLPRPSTEGQSAELRAAAAGSLEDVLALVAAAAPLDAPGGQTVGEPHSTSPVRRGTLAVAEALLAAGADKDAKSAWSANRAPHRQPKRAPGRGRGAAGCGRRQGRRAERRPQPRSSFASKKGTWPWSRRCWLRAPTRRQLAAAGCNRARHRQPERAPGRGAGAAGCRRRRAGQK